MKANLHLLSLQIIILIIFSEIIPPTLCINLKKLFKPENEEVLKIMKEELDQFRIDMTKSFMKTHSRRKRAQDGHVNDINIDTLGSFQEIATDSVGPFSTFTFAGKPFIIRRDGIYQLNGLTALSEGKSISPNNAIVKKGSWMLGSNEIVLNGFEWKRNFFLVTTTGNFSAIYTLHENSLQPVFRQNIHNKANAVGAEFFDYRRNLYMVILNDNEMHSTTFSPIFRWAGSYMDEIHQVQTTGASAVKTFMINGKEYIAIAQSRDSTDNPQVGTMVLSMDHVDRLERVQLLWSNGANNLHYMQTEKEHFLVIGQEKEPSIVYWFGGMDFIYWQQFEGLQGKDLVMEGVQLTSDEPILLTSDGGLLQFFSRSASATKIMTTWIRSKTLSVFDPQPLARASANNQFKITQLKILQVGEDKDNVFLAITRKIPGSPLDSIRMYPVKFVKRQLSVSQTKEPGDTLSQCLQSVRTSLKDSEENLKRLDQISSVVLTTDGDWEFDGEIASKKVIKPASSQVKSAEILPSIERAGSSDRFETSPSKLMDNIKQSNVKLEVMKSQLDNVFYKSKRPNVVTGDLTFLKSVQFDKIEAFDGTNLKFDIINGVSWENLDNFALKTSFPEPQLVISEWTVDSIKADAFNTVKTDSKLSAKNFMLTSCIEPQTVSGLHQFNKELKIGKEVKVEPETAINGIQFSNVVLKENSAREIHGYKHAPFVKGNYNSLTVNSVNLNEWFASVARLSGTTEQTFTGPVAMGENAVIQIDSLTVDEMNGKNWNEFEKSVMIDGVNQDVEGLFNIEALRTDNLKANNILGTSSDDLLTTGKNQRVTSHFTIQNVEIDGPLSTDAINGMQLSDVVNRNDEQVEINGPVVLENFQVQDVLVSEGVTIAEKDVSELENLKKVHTYTTIDNSPIFIKQAIVDRLSTDHIDEESIADFTTKYWSSAGENVANPAQLVLDNRKVFISKGNFKTGKLNHFNFPDEFVSLDQDVITLHAPLQFKHPVKVAGDVTMTNGATIQGIDMSEAQSMIVDANFKGMVRGVKTFAEPLRAVHGADIGMLNGINPRDDVVMLNSDELQRVEGTLKFEKDVATDEFTVMDGNVDVQGLVNKVHLGEVKDTTAYKGQENRIEGDLVFETGLNVDKLSALHINSLNIKDITDNMIFLQSHEMQSIAGLVTLENGGAEFLTDSIASSINNVPLMEYLSQVIRLDSTEGSMISGTKTFMNANLNDKLMCNTFSNVDLKDLESNAFSKSKSQVVTGKWSVNDANFNGNLETSQIEGISLDNIVYTNEPVDILSPVAFTSRQTSIQGPLSVMGNVNGIRFDKNMENSIAIDGIHNFDQLIVDGDLDWVNDRPELQRLSYFFENAVTKSGPQTVTGGVTFSKGFQSSEISTPEKWLADVNLQRIQEDVVMKDATDMMLSGSNAFAKPLKIQNLVNPVNKLDVSLVNDINLKSMSDDIVQTDDVSDQRKILGRKLLRSPLQVNNLKVKDKIGNVSTRDLVLTDNEVEISQVQFSDFRVEEDIESVSTLGLDLGSLMDNRVSLSKPNQQLQGDFSFQRVSVVDSTNGCKVPTINDINVSNVLKKSQVKNLRTISGKKTFKNLLIEGQVETQSLNNLPIQNLLDSTYRVDRKEIITRPVIFEAPVIVNQQLEVESINDIHIEQFSNQVSERISRLVSDAERPMTLSKELSVEASKLQQITQERPVWLEYLRMKQDMTSLGLGAQTKVDHVQVKSGDIFVTLHRDADGQEKGLPKGCQCNSIFTVNLREFSDSKIDTGSRVKSIGADQCLNVFNVVSPNKRSYMVISESTSSNTTCVTDKDDTTKIFQGEQEISNTKMGYISDVGVFSEKETDFIVLAQYFDKNTKSHSTVTRVMRIDPSGHLENVQNIETHGARKVALSKVNNIWMLAIANSKSSIDESSCNADSAVYMWSSTTNQFLLMRTVMTDGAFDVQFIVTETSNEFYKQSFVAFAQEGNSASGEVMIFRYEQPGGNFVMSQTLRSNWPVTGLRTTCLCRQCFLVTTVPQEGITFYENRFVEGFQEYYKAPVFGATDISGFQVGDQHLFAIATNKGPILAEAVIAGSCPN